MDEQCTCYPGGATPATYEGPQPWCNVHSDAAAGYEQGKLDGRREQADLCCSGLCGHAEHAS